MISLTSLTLVGNLLTGTIPTVLMTLPLLQELNLDYNHLTGKIPSNIGVATNLLKHFNNNQLTGSIPPTISQASKLQQINLSNNKLTYVLPKSLATMGSLITFDVSQNLLTMGPGVHTQPPATFNIATLEANFGLLSRRDNCINFDYVRKSSGTSLSVLVNPANCPSPTGQLVNLRANLLVSQQDNQPNNLKDNLQDSLLDNLQANLLVNPQNNPQVNLQVNRQVNPPDTQLNTRPSIPLPIPLPPIPLPPLPISLAPSLLPRPTFVLPLPPLFTFVPQKLPSVHAFTTRFKYAKR